MSRTLKLQPSPVVGAIGSSPMSSSSAPVRSMESKHKSLVILRCKLVIVGILSILASFQSHWFLMCCKAMLVWARLLSHKFSKAVAPPTPRTIWWFNNKISVLFVCNPNSRSSLSSLSLSQTIGAEFCVKQVPIPESNAVVELYIYDCAGQSIFNQIEMNAKFVSLHPFLSTSTTTSPFLFHLSLSLYLPLHRLLYLQLYLKLSILVTII